MCLLCKQKGEYSVTGRLIPYKLNMYVHTSCALWTNEVFDIDDGQIINFYQQQKKLIHQKCAICGDLGATLSCAKTKGCSKHFHFPCAYRSGKVKFTKAQEVFCEQCNRARGSDEQNLTTFPTDYMKKKRLYIVRNLEEINQQEYENESEPGGKGKKSGALSATPKKRDGDSDIPKKEIEVDKWRPFYFDLFNRVGNLTVLSLRKEVNQLIDIVTKDSAANGATSIQAYIQ
jgi:hypothetical protein